MSESGSRLKLSQAEAAVARSEFRDPQAAREILQRIAGQVPPGTLEALGTLLPDSPDPDGALSSFERLLESGGRELALQLEKDGYGPVLREAGLAPDVDDAATETEGAGEAAR